jgi:hypothetical protein
MKKIRIAIVGYGGMGSKHPKIMNGNEMVECAGAYDIKPERMEVARADGFHTYASMEELLADPKVGAVMRGTGGIRKMRFAFEQQGKSGSARVIYVDFEVYEKIASGRNLVVTENSDSSRTKMEEL